MSLEGIVGVQVSLANHNIYLAADSIVKTSTYSIPSYLKAHSARSLLNVIINYMHLLGIALNISCRFHVCRQDRS